MIDKYTKKGRVWIGFFVLLLLVVGFGVRGGVGVAHAATYTANPKLITAELTFRETYRDTISVTNTAAHNINIYTEVVAINENGDMVSEEPQSTILDWIEIQRSSTEVAPGETFASPLEIRVPVGAVPGTYYARISYGSGTTIDAARTQIAAGATPSTIVTLTVADDRFGAVNLNSFSVSRIVHSAPNKAIEVQLTNTGTAPVTPEGQIIFYDTAGKEMSSVPFNTASTTIEPGATTLFTESVAIDGLRGRHKAALAIRYHDGSDYESITDFAYFTVLPLPILFGLAATIVVLVILLAILYVRRKQTRQQSEAYIRISTRDTTSNHTDNDLDLRSQL